jgi:hypothetical protein
MSHTPTIPLPVSVLKALLDQGSGSLGSEGRGVAGHLFRLFFGNHNIMVYDFYLEQCPLDSPVFTPQHSPPLPRTLIKETESNGSWTVT